MWTEKYGLLRSSAGDLRFDLRSKGSDQRRAILQSVSSRSKDRFERVMGRFNFQTTVLACLFTAVLFLSVSVAQQITGRDVTSSNVFSAK